MKTDIPPKLLEAFELALQSQNSGNVRAFGQLLEAIKFSDPLQLLASKTAKKLFPVKLNRRNLNFEQWIESIHDWLGHYKEPGDKSYAENLLYIIWSSFEGKLRGELAQSRHHGIIPPEGGVLAFIAAATRCIVVEYEFQETVAELHPIAVIIDPRSLFDFWGTIDRVTTTAAQNALKKIQSSGHKLVYHRGTLVHVDRRLEPKVFGPTIDTILLAEVLVQDVLRAHPDGVQTALEVGCGNGMISAALIQNNPHLKTLVAVDSDFSSVACTNKNCSLALQTSDSKATISLINGRFAPGFLTTKFDLCVCNPPYLPLPPEQGKSLIDRFADNRRATGGTELMQQLIKHVDRILAPAGSLLIITSGLSLKGAKANIPKNFSCHQPYGNEGLPVIFDVDSVVTDEQWLQYLISNCGLKRAKHGFTHTLHSLIITRSRL